jgi:hypothetical protein
MNTMDWDCCEPRLETSSSARGRRNWTQLRTRVRAKTYSYGHEPPPPFGRCRWAVPPPQLTAGAVRVWAPRAVLVARSVTTGHVPRS